MCDLLYLWARENPEYLYQQGMNDVLAVIMVCLASELHSDADRDETASAMLSSAERTAHILHSQSYFWSEAYAMYEAMMRLGVKDIYYREDGAREALMKKDKKLS
jgi:hypothetical protein